MTYELKKNTKKKAQEIDNRFNFHNSTLYSIQYKQERAL